MKKRGSAKRPNIASYRTTAGILHNVSTSPPFFFCEVQRNEAKRLLICYFVLSYCKCATIYENSFI